MSVIQFTTHQYKHQVKYWTTKDNVDDHTARKYENYVIPHFVIGVLNHL